MNIRELGVFADAVYGANKGAVETAAGRPVLKFSQAAGRLNGFQAAAFDAGRGLTVVAFRGTSQAMDGVADVKLSAGMNSTYFSAGEAFLDGLVGGSIILCGHSLGGAIAQTVANRQRIPMVTFNAPGVAVLATRHIISSSVPGMAIRLGGMTLSAFRHPMQAARDVRSAFYKVRGLNVCLDFDIVSQIGMHYGEVRRIPGTSANPMTEHRMTTMNTVLARDPVGAIDVGTF
ncbi:MAG: hypothetical protein JWM33_2761 [Caulobacteraceae bacterium]|nr:hypothetical protein [Caulobacteraceae bacterium]